ncbi:MAG: prenyltransferase/squalene oxidase repeat-containing protein [Verrucomicrobiae bacterium]
MIRVARCAPGLLGGSAGLVRDFVLGKQTADGGFQDRAGRSDLYYTVFGLQSLLALEAPFAVGPLRSYLAAFGDGDGLDFVHLSCLARCRALLRDAENFALNKSRSGDGSRGAGEEKSGFRDRSLARRIEAHRSADGGYHPAPGSPSGTAYAAFLALGAHQDLRIPLPGPARLADALRPLATPDGAWANERPPLAASTNPTAAALAVLGALRPLSVSRKTGRWLLAQSHPLGGFRASPLAPLPDLLSTATALHALAALGIPIESVREPCLGFIDSLWSNEGGFHGHWHDDRLDVEYAFHGLLALGRLA